MVCRPIQEGGLGIPSLIVRREALLAKHASRFILEPQGLWSALMRERYGEWTSGVTIIPPRGSSFLWKEVCTYGQCILDNTSWSIGDGQLIDVIQDAWISELPLSRWPSFINMDGPPNLRVKDLILSDPPLWHTPLVTSLFGAELSKRILSLPLLPGVSVDSRLWQRSCLPKAPVRDLMKIFRPLSQRFEDAAWIWKLPVIPRIQLFIWKLLRDCLPTCALLSRRGVPIEPICPLCGQEEETLDHAIFLCPRARLIWYLMGYPNSIDGLASRRFSFVHDLRRGAQRRRALWASTAYQIWMSRNQIIFSNESVHPHLSVRRIRMLMTECARLIDSDYPGPWGSPATAVANRHTVSVSWEPPPPGFVKINFDGSVRGRMAGSAFVIRGQAGDLIAVGGFGSLDSSVPMAELYAAWAGISYAVRTLQADRIIVEGDSSTVISWLQKGNSLSYPTFAFLRDIWTMLRDVATGLIRHIYREANSAADWAASFVAQHDGPWSLRPTDLCPPSLQQILLSDLAGLTHTRIV